MAHFSLIATPRRAARSTRAPVGREPDGDGNATPAGPGWFESSWELVRGLEVREGLPDGAGLNEWLAVCLAGPPATLCER
jgi:hypothetical protein